VQGLVAIAHLLTVRFATAVGARYGAFAAAGGAHDVPMTLAHGRNLLIPTADGAEGYTLTTKGARLDLLIF